MSEFSTAEQWPALFKIDAARISGARTLKPMRLFNHNLRTDLARKLGAEGTTRGVFDGRTVYGMVRRPEYLDPRGDAGPRGWIVTGYPCNDSAMMPTPWPCRGRSGPHNDYPRIDIAGVTYRAVRFSGA